MTPSGVICVVVIIMIVIIVSYKSRAPPNQLPALAALEAVDPRHMDTIFVSIPCFEDSSECARTICDLFSQATCPHRVFVGVLDQSSVTDATVSLLNMYDREAHRQNKNVYVNNVRVIRVKDTDARGPMFARGVIERTMYKREKYFMTVDSHMRFVKHWDRLVIESFCSINNPKAVLTTLPANYDRHLYQSTDAAQLPTFTVVDRVDSDQFPILSYRYFHRLPRHAYLTPFYCPTFSFALGHIVRKCPTDLMFEYIFFPEMMIRSVQLFCQGYTFFTPPVTLCYHCDDRSYRPHYWSLMDEQAERRHALSVDRARAIFGVNLCRTCSIQRSDHTSARQGHAFVVEDALSVPTTYQTTGRRTLREFEDYTGIRMDSEAPEISAPARLGCVGGGEWGRPTVEERVTKYASEKIYQQLVMDTPVTKKED